ncbi:MAG TPA: PAS domain S-box protein [Blastocatellia bacterium]|nr:PAS domain S-box protein [Blastocatellia bacterium]
MTKDHSSLLRYGVAALAVVVSTLVREPLIPLMGLRVAPFTLFYPAIMLAGWYGGLGPGLFATALSALSAIYFFILPEFSLAISDAGVAFGLALFLFSGTFISVINEAWHREKRKVEASNLALAESRETEARQRELLQVTLSSIGDAVIATDAEGVITFMNPVASSLTGWEVSAARGKPLAEVFKIINEYSREEVESPVGKVLWEGSVVGLANHTILIAKDGSEIPIDDSGAPIKVGGGSTVGVVLVFRDITEQKKAEQTAFLLASIVGSSNDAIIGKSMDGTIVTWNEGAQRLYGYSPEEAVGLPVSVLMPPERADDFPEIMERLKKGEKIDHYETVRLSKDGRLINVSVTISPIKDSGGKIIGASTVARDITERKLIEEERESLLARETSARLEAEQARQLSVELLRREQVTRSEAEAANRAKDEFVATLSHELRTPLNAILGWAAMLRGGKLDEESSRRAIEIIERNARAQAQLIDDILDISRIITGKLRLDVAPVELATVIHGAVDVVRPAAEAKEIRLQVLLDPRAGPVSGDSDRLQQIVWNLLSNAVKFTPRGGRVQVRLERVNSHVEIIVSDTGQGIKQEFLPYVFDRFRQADSTLSRMHGGLGLGLAIVRHLVELHGGTVEVISGGEGQGATFTVKLPLIIIHDRGRYKPAAAESADPSTPPGPRIDYAPALDGIRLLIVEDEPDARELLIALLTQSGAQTRAVATAAEALDALRQWRPDLLLSNIEMPGEDGYSLIHTVRSLGPELGGQVPAVALTAHARVEDRVRALSAGFQSHITKPVNPAELVAVIRSLARRSRTA